MKLIPIAEQWKFDIKNTIYLGSVMEKRRREEEVKKKKTK